MRVTVQFYSYFRELTGCSESIEELPDGATLGELHLRLIGKFPKLAPMQRSTLIAVGVDYQTRDYVLRDHDEVSLFPPVQGG
jgi:molybdopterin converting factor small subunit